MEDYFKWKIADLKRELSNRKLPVSGTKADFVRRLVLKDMAEQHLKDIYEILEEAGGKMNLPTEAVDEHQLWDRLRADKTIKLSERFMYTDNCEIVVIERIK
jgi:hypothetical protein